MEERIRGIICLAGVGDRIGSCEHIVTNMDLLNLRS